MCSGGGGGSTAATVVPISAVSDSTKTESAVRTTAKKQRGKSGVIGNTLAVDRADQFGGTGVADATVRNTMG